MTDPLYVTNEDPVNLSSAIDGSDALQIWHRGDCLVDYDQRLHVEHDDLEDSNGVVRIKIFDFTHGGDNWEITASHDSAGGSVSWSRDTNHAYRDFGAMSSELEVDITATSDASPPVIRQQTVYIKTSPIESTSDRRRL